MRNRILAEILFFILLLAAAYSTWFDATCFPGPTISQMTSKLIYWQPMFAFVAGMFVLLLIWGIHKLWEIRFRYVLAMIILGICLGHLFWSQDLPFAREPHRQMTGK
jgi:ABC-type Fe3+-siderophore transport system permease subunit